MNAPETNSHKSSAALISSDSLPFPYREGGYPITGFSECGIDPAPHGPHFYSYGEYLYACLGSVSPVYANAALECRFVEGDGGAELRCPEEWPDSPGEWCGRCLARTLTCGDYKRGVVTTPAGVAGASDPSHPAARSEYRAFLNVAGALSNLLYAARHVHDPSIDEWTDAVALGEATLARLKAVDRV